MNFENRHAQIRSARAWGPALRPLHGGRGLAEAPRSGETEPALLAAHPPTRSGEDRPASCAALKPPGGSCVLPTGVSRLVIATLRRFAARGLLRPPSSEETRSAPREAGRSASPTTPATPSATGRTPRWNATRTARSRPSSELYDSLGPRLRRYLLRASRDPGVCRRPASTDDAADPSRPRAFHRRCRSPALGLRHCPEPVPRRRSPAQARGPHHLARDGRTRGHPCGGRRRAARRRRAHRFGAALPRPAGRVERLPESHRAAFELIKNEGSVNPRGRRGARRHAHRRQAARPSRLRGTSCCAGRPGRPQLGRASCSNLISNAKSSPPRLPSRRHTPAAPDPECNPDDFALAVPLLLFLLVGGPGSGPGRSGSSR